MLMMHGGMMMMMMMMMMIIKYGKDVYNGKTTSSGG